MAHGCTPRTCTTCPRRSENLDLDGVHVMVPLESRTIPSQSLPWAAEDVKLQNEARTICDLASASIAVAKCKATSLQ